ncbi:uncharacterized protein DFL_003283 [Arthrobotrys flagrans]|uniref:Uncharacterized protein n=1 Tax=Arthrobotrys flagrans TaxID=97331 RepID=A0A437A1E5_ARTFL|nr:hypothetical protein DFL_003283 [Arthrobotrys flagrans]
MKYTLDREVAEIGRTLFPTYNRLISSELKVTISLQARFEFYIGDSTRLETRLISVFPLQSVTLASPQRFRVDLSGGPISLNQRVTISRVDRCSCSKENPDKKSATPQPDCFRLILRSPLPHRTDPIHHLEQWRPTPTQATPVLDQFSRKKEPRSSSKDRRITYILIPTFVRSFVRWFCWLVESKLAPSCVVFGSVVHTSVAFAKEEGRLSNLGLEYIVLDRAGVHSLPSSLFVVFVAFSNIRSRNYRTSLRWLWMWMRRRMVVVE